MEIFGTTFTQGKLSKTSPNPGMDQNLMAERQKVALVCCTKIIGLVESVNIQHVLKNMMIFFKLVSVTGEFCLTEEIHFCS